jgi:hypothetical protein
MSGELRSVLVDHVEHVGVVVDSGHGGRTAEASSSIPALIQDGVDDEHDSVGEANAVLMSTYIQQIRLVPFYFFSVVARRSLFVYAFA